MEEVNNFKIYKQTLGFLPEYVGKFFWIAEGSDTHGASLIEISLTEEQAIERLKTALKDV